MGWHHKQGKEVLGSITDLPGDIMVASKAGAPVQIKIIEAWQAKRILGARCALDGKDGAEFELTGWPNSKRTS